MKNLMRYMLVMMGLGAAWCHYVEAKELFIWNDSNQRVKMTIFYKALGHEGIWLNPKERTSLDTKGKLIRRVDVTDKDDKKYLVDGRDMPSGGNVKVKIIEFSLYGRPPAPQRGEILFRTAQDIMNPESF